MRKKLWILDLTLLGLVVVVGGMLKDRWNVTQAREQALLRQMLPVAAVPPIPALDGVKPASAASYLDVAQHFLFSRDRNPTVILDPPPPPPPPPPPKPVPAFPLAYGVMDLGAGPTIILREKPEAQSRGYRTGETIGEFKIIALNNRDIVFEWDGQQFPKHVEELIDKRTPQAAAQQAPAPAAAAPAPAAAPVKGGPGVELGEKSRACVPGDTTPAGTVQNGWRKVTNRTPFGESCRWEAVSQ